MNFFSLKLNFISSKYNKNCKEKNSDESILGTEPISGENIHWKLVGREREGNRRTELALFFASFTWVAIINIFNTLLQLFFFFKYNKILTP